MTIEKRALHGTLIGVLAFGANLIQSIAVVPFLLRGWGGAAYGSWVALQAFVTLVTTLDSGHSENIGNECQQLISTQKPIDVVFGSGLAVALGISTLELCAVTGLALGGLVPWCMGLGPDAPGYAHAGAAAVVLVAASALATAPNGLFVRLFLPHGKYVRAQLWSIALRLTTALVLVAAVAARKSILGAAVLVAATTAIVQTCSSVDASRLFRVGPRILLRANMKTGLHGLWRSLIRTGSICLGQFHLTGLIVALAAAIGPTGVAAFATTRTIVSALMQGSTIVALPLSPEMIRFRSTGDWARLRAALRGMWFIGGLMMNLAVVCILPVVQVGYHFWTRGVFELDRAVFVMLALSACTRAAGVPLAFYLAGVNHTRFLVSSSVIQGTVTIGCAAATVGTFGTRGAAFAVLAGEICGMLLVPSHEYARDCRENGQASARPDLLFGAIPLLGVGTTLTLFAVTPISPLVLAPCGVGAVALVHAWQWRQLPTEVRRRILGALTARWRRKS